MFESTARDSFLVVFAVLWGGSLPGIGRLDPFTTSRWFASDMTVRKMAQRRWVWGTLLANIGSMAVLGGVWSLLPVTKGGWGLFGGGFAGLSAVAFPRLLHAALASDERWHKFYTEEDWHRVLKRWDERYQPGTPGSLQGANSFRAHFVWGVVYLIVPVLVGLCVGHIAA